MLIVITMLKIYFKLIFYACAENLLALTYILTHYFNSFLMTILFFLSLQKIKKKKKSWMRLGFLVDAKGRVPVKVISRTFASGKTEKMVYQCLSELGLPSGKNESMVRDDFTFDKFYALYHKICPRNDIEELFRSM